MKSEKPSISSNCTSLALTAARIMANRRMVYTRNCILRITDGTTWVFNYQSERAGSQSKWVKRGPNQEDEYVYKLRN